MNKGYAIRKRAPEDDEALLTIENRATELLRDHGYPSVADHPLASLSDFRSMLVGHDAWVAVAEPDKPVGYAVAGAIDRYFHLRELAVDPDHQQRGIGTALVKTVLEAARNTGASGVTLTTFRDVPFNAPFYQGIGFEELPLDNAPEVLRTIFYHEVPKDVDPARRVLMLKEM